MKEVIIENLQIDVLIKLFCAYELTIQGDKGTIKGNPIDLKNKYGFPGFVKALNKYYLEGKVSVLWHKPPPQQTQLF